MQRIAVVVVATLAMVLALLGVPAGAKIGRAHV